MVWHYDTHIFLLKKKTRTHGAGVGAMINQIQGAASPMAAVGVGARRRRGHQVR